jgi:hypothetical protein
MLQMHLPEHQTKENNNQGCNRVDMFHKDVCNAAID